jgi:prepilin-type processing-associated H-X9-DG protein/prepilin-type N-terminal cleavage/methylation domain-containing protein
MFRDRRRNCGGFTVIELLVVIALIALLMAILMPSLSKARKHTRAVVCLSNMNHIGKAISNYLYECDGTYPASYLYPDDDRGNWSMETQRASHPDGYAHWSYNLYDDGQVEEKGFECPAMENGGAPRTNPGLKPEDWELGEQVDQTGNGKPNELTDKQAPRMAYTANAAIIPRNKFTSELSSGMRLNKFVPDSKIKRPGDTVLVTEFLDNWKALGILSGGSDSLLVKSHRPVNPFYHMGSGYNEYAPSDHIAGFIYGTQIEPGGDDEDCPGGNCYGLWETKAIKDRRNILDHSSGLSQMNAVGRHHPGGDPRLRDRFGGTANFLFCDGHAEPLMVIETLDRRLWGDRYYSLTGENRIMNMSKEAPVKGH